MTIKEYAENRKISRQAIYQMISKAGKRTSDFTDSDGELTEQGLSALNDLFKSRTSKQSKVNVQAKLHDKTSEIVDLRKRVEQLSKENVSLTETVDRLSRTLEKQTESLNLAQQLHAKEILRLEAAASERDQEKEPSPVPVIVSSDPEPDLSTFRKRLKFVFSAKKKG